MYVNPCAYWLASSAEFGDAKSDNQSMDNIETTYHALPVVTMGESVTLQPKKQKYLKTKKTKKRSL